MIINKATIGAIAGFIAAIAYIPYIISILKGKSKPSRATFFIWSLINFVLLTSYIASGARTTIWTISAYTVGAFIVLLLSLSPKRGMGGFNKLDISCVIGAVIGIVLWIVTDDPRTALYISIIIDALGFVPTFRKVYLDPKSEALPGWAMGCFAAGLNVIAITSLKPEMAVYPIYTLTSTLALVSLMLFPGIRYKRN